MCHLLPYLDHFFIAGTPGTSECQENLDAILSLCQQINAPIMLSKVEGPCTNIKTSHSLEYVVLDTVTMTASIYNEQKQEYVVISKQSMIKCHKCTKQQQLSLISKLSFSRKVVPAGRIFYGDLLI